MARRSPSQLSGRPQVNAITARSKGPGASAPKEEAPLSVNPAVREFVIASAVAKYASFLRAQCSAKSSRFSGLLNGSGHVRIGFWRRRGPHFFFRLHSDTYNKFGCKAHFHRGQFPSHSAPFVLNHVASHGYKHGGAK